MITTIRRRKQLRGTRIGLVFGSAIESDVRVVCHVGNLLAGVFDAAIAALRVVAALGLLAVAVFVRGVPAVWGADGHLHVGLSAARIA